MKSNKYIKFLLSLLILLTIISVNTEITPTSTYSTFEGNFQLLEDEFEDSILGNWDKQ